MLSAINGFCVKAKTNFIGPRGSCLNAQIAAFIENS